MADEITLFWNVITENETPLQKLIVQKFLSLSDFQQKQGARSLRMEYKKAADPKYLSYQAHRAMTRSRKMKALRKSAKKSAKKSVRKTAKKSGRKSRKAVKKC